jgi:hypothetical protein
MNRERQALTEPSTPNDSPERAAVLPFDFKDRSTTSYPTIYKFSSALRPSFPKIIHTSVHQEYSTVQKENNEKEKQNCERKKEKKRLNDRPPTREINNVPPEQLLPVSVADVRVDIVVV